MCIDQGHMAVADRIPNYRPAWRSAHSSGTVSKSCVEFVKAAAAIFPVAAQSDKMVPPKMGESMNRILTALSAAAFVASPAIAQDQMVPADGGKIIMFRVGGIMGMGVGCPLRYKGQEVVELGRNKFAEWPVPAGSYILTNKTASVEVNVMPGQTKYVRCTIKPGFLTGRADLQIVDAETFTEHQAEYERKEVAAISIASN